VRGTSLSKSMSHYLIEQIEANQKIEVRTETSCLEVKGDERLESIILQKESEPEREEIEAAALFIFIGAIPHTNMLEGVIQRNRSGFIPTGQELIKNGKRPTGWVLKRDPFYLETSVPGIFAAGDVRQGAVRRVASAVGDGAIAVSLVHQYLQTV